jgi:DNA-binding Lrp family transcriptional regulator
MDVRLREALEQGRGIPIRPLADALGVTPNTIYQAIKRHEIKVFEVGRSKRVTPAEGRRLLAMVESAAA